MISQIINYKQKRLNDEKLKLCVELTSLDQQLNNAYNNMNFFDAGIKDAGIKMLFVKNEIKLFC